MTKDTKELLRKAMAMPAGQRAWVAQELLRSLEPAVDQDVEAAWQQESARRLEQSDRGHAPSVTWESVRERLRKP